MSYLVFPNQLCDFGHAAELAAFEFTYMPDKGVGLNMWFSKLSPR